MWAKLLHNWDIRWTIPLLPLLAVGWIIGIFGLGLILVTLCRLITCSIENIKVEVPLCLMGVMMVLPYMFVLFLNVFEIDGKYRITLFIFCLYMGIILIIFALSSCRIRKYVLYWRETAKEQGNQYDPNTGLMQGVNIANKEKEPMVKRALSIN